MKATVASAAASGLALSGASNAAGYHHGVDDTLKIGLIGCGGRGTGAVIDACKADSQVQVTALADAFADRIQICRDGLKNQPDVASKFAVTDDTCFDGMDGYKHLIDSGVDVVLLAQPPYFRPESLKYAVEAGKHVFCEKPVAVDVPGALSVLETCKNAGGKSIVSGLCWRYDLAVREVMSRIKDGAIGDIKAIQANYLTGELWHRGNDPSWSQMEYQLRNWLYFAWLSGDMIAEQHIHSLDKALWLMNDEPPAVCYGIGGCQKRTGREFGNVYDHFACCYEWADGTRCFSYCRQMNGCFNETDDFVFGTQGTARTLKFEIDGHAGKWEYSGRKPSMYEVEHQHLFRSIREGNPINNGNYMVYSTLMAIMGRDACYTGKRIKWDEFLNDQTKLGPALGNFEQWPVPIPGDT